MLWGEIATDIGIFKDVKLWPGGGRLWDWNETGTDHSSGIQPADAEEVLEHGTSVLVLSTGQEDALEAPEETVQAIENRGVQVEVLNSKQAVDRYNELADEGEAVGALIHSTC